MIVLRLDRMLAERKVSGKELAERIGLSPVNLSRIKTGKVSAVRFSTLEAMCRALDCQPGDLLEYIPDDEVGDDLGLHEADRRATGGHDGRIVIHDAAMLERYVMD